MEGVIVKIVETKGFGFIKSNENQKEYFFHRSDYQGDFSDLEAYFLDNPKEGIQVNFDVVQSNKGLRAGKVYSI